MKYQGYKDLQIYKLAHRLAVEIHHMTLRELPKFEMYEQGSQIRRSSKSIAANIVEGFSLRKYTKEFSRYLAQSNASLDETKEHLLILHETDSFKDGERFKYFTFSYEELGRMIYSFMNTLAKRRSLYETTKNIV